MALSPWEFPTGYYETVHLNLMLVLLYRHVALPRACFTISLYVVSSGMKNGDAFDLIKYMKA